MKILVIGSGGREHALVWKLKQSPQVETLWCAPGNGGISKDAECLAVDAKNVPEIAALAEKLRPDLSIIGPEQPLVSGVVDEFEKRGLPIVGPTAAAARLEGSKAFAKEFMQRHAIPTASAYGIHDSAGAAYSALCAVDWPVVIKADGLCAGKGVMVAPTPDDATAFIERLMDKREFGDAGNVVLLEEALEGEELSYIVLTDGETVLPLVPTQDHKRAFDGDRGPNTGGMGAYSMDGMISAALEKTILDTIVQPTIRGLSADGLRYRGFLYFGLMLTPDGPRVLEFNCRMGDPETQAIVMRMDFDLSEACLRAASSKLSGFNLKWHPGASACVVMASSGYPESYQQGKKITGLDSAKAGSEAAIFHAGTRREGNDYYTSGGRVLGVSARSADLNSALRMCYDNCSNIAFESSFFRSDIGHRALSRSAKGAF